MIPALTACLLLTVSAFSQEDGAVVLPDSGPVPQDSPQTDTPQTEAPAAELANPDASEPEPIPPAEQEATKPDELPSSQAAPFPSPRPTAGRLLPPLPEGAAEPVAPKPVAPTSEPDTKTATPAKPARPAGMPEEELACRNSLRELGVAFEEHPPQSEPEGCEIAHPITVSSLGDGVALEPAGVMNCAVAETNARFVREQAQPQAEQHMSSRIAAINQVSGYVCRPRNGTSKLSEHAFGNALDWGAIILEDERRIEVRAYRRGSPEGLFLAGIRKRACGPFTTVLGPGSDADHADHFHFDLAQRSNGSTFCQ